MDDFHPPQSPTIERRRIENEHLREEWDTCCSKSNREFIKYITQVGFGVSVMVFSMIQIARDVGGNEIYFSLLSGTLGLFLPHPQMNAMPRSAREDVL
jgi:hypothetical protein